MLQEIIIIMWDSNLEVWQEQDIEAMYNYAQASHDIRGEE